MAVRTKTQLKADTLTRVPDNQIGEVSPEDIRDVVEDIVDSAGFGEDYTSAEKSKLNSVAAGAEVNVQSDWNASSGDAFIQNKPTNRLIPSGGTTGQVIKKDSATDYDVSWQDDTGGGGGGGATNLSVTNRDTDSLDIASSTGNDAEVPSATRALAGLQSAADKTKLDGIAQGAEVNVQSDWNASSGDAQILNKPTIPAAQVQTDWNATAGLAEILNKPGAVSETEEGLFTAGNFIKLQDVFEDVSISGNTITFTQFDGNTETITLPSSGGGATDLALANRTGTSLDITSSTGDDARLPSASTTQAGLQSAADKTKLNGIAQGAEVNVQSDWNATGGDAFIRNKPTMLGGGGGATWTRIYSFNPGNTNTRITSNETGLQPLRPAATFSTTLGSTHRDNLLKFSMRINDGWIEVMMRASEWIDARTYGSTATSINSTDDCWLIAGPSTNGAWVPSTRNRGGGGGWRGTFFGAFGKDASSGSDIVLFLNGQSTGQATGAVIYVIELYVDMLEFGGSSGGTTPTGTHHPLFLAYGSDNSSRTEAPTGADAKAIGRSVEAADGTLSPYILTAPSAPAGSPNVYRRWFIFLPSDKRISALSILQTDGETVLNPLSSFRLYDGSDADSNPDTFTIAGETGNFVVYASNRPVNTLYGGTVTITTIDN